MKSPFPISHITSSSASIALCQSSLIDGIISHNGNRNSFTDCIMSTGTHSKNAHDLATGHVTVVFKQETQEECSPTRKKSKHGNQYDPPAEVLANMSKSDLSKWR